MSYYPVIEREEFLDVVDRWKSTFDTSLNIEATNFSYVMDNGSTPWINEFKVSKTLAGVQAFIDAGRTYLGAVHRVVMDSSNNGLYVILNGSNGLEYRKISSSQASLIQSPSVSMVEAQNGYFSSLGGNYHSDYSIDGPFEFDRAMLYGSMGRSYSTGDLPLEYVRTAATYDDAIKICSPVLFDETIYDYYSWPGNYISVTADPDQSKNGLYFVTGDVYNEMRLVKLAFAANPTISQHISISDAENEYWSLFPQAWRAVNMRGGYEWDQSRRKYNEHIVLALGHLPAEAFTVFKTFEDAQKWLLYLLYSSNRDITFFVSPNPNDVIPSFNEGRRFIGGYSIGRLNCYPGKVFSVIDDPDPSKNGLYMVTATISYYTTDFNSTYQRISDYGFIKMQTE